MSEHLDHDAFEFNEMKLEIARHHKTFQKISSILDTAFHNLGVSGEERGWDYLLEIRNIVG